MKRQQGSESEHRPQVSPNKKMHQHTQATVASSRMTYKH